ncbi:hypothetical protein [Pseudodesulfovibrio sp.]|uniref:hypothetical protein n=1 Tax=unclassified Pseudodesulfovibrio TaxID=2661612 RepID=UPI003B008188
MPYEFEVKEEDRYLLLVVSGEVETIEDMRAFSKALVECAEEKGYKRLILDQRLVSRKLDLHDYMVYADQWRLERPPSGIKIAAVYSQEDVNNFQWVETICQNRSIIYRIFSNSDEAERWLAC